MQQHWDPFIEQIVIFLVMAPSVWVAWYLPIFVVHPTASSHEDRRLLYWSPLLCLSMLAVVLVLRNPGNPVESRFQILLGFLACAFWLRLLNSVFPYLGLSAREDVAERRNRFAAWSIAGAQLGLTLCFAGTVVGHGGVDEVWVALLPGFIETLAFWGLWALLESLTHLSDAITIDRDGGAALRLAAFLAALGLLLGQSYRPSAMDEWKPWARLICPIGLLIAALLVERRYKRFWDWTFGPPRHRDFWISSSYLVSAGLGVFLTR